LSVGVDEYPSTGGLTENKILTGENGGQFQYAGLGSIDIEAHAEPFDRAIDFGSEEIERG